MTSKNILAILLVLTLVFNGCHAEIPTPEVKTLTLATFGSTPQLSRWVNTYNENRPGVSIEIVNYQDTYPDPFEAMKQLKIEIVAGKGPDMVELWDYSPLDASSGMLVDLYPYMQNDEDFVRDDFYANIIDSFAIGDALFVLVPAFIIKSFATTNHNLADLESMTIWQLMDAYDKLDDESILFPGETKVDVLAMLCYGGLQNYVDWDAGTCSFDSDSFKEILAFANRFPHQLVWTNDLSAKEFFAEGRSLLYPVSINNVYGTAGTRMLFGEKPTYIGYPFDSGNGNLADIASLAVGISSSSQHKEEAWDFVKSLLASGFQDDIGSGLPVRASTLEQRLAAAMVAELNAGGEKVVQERILWDGEDPINIHEITAEDADALRAIINKIEFNATLDRALYSIILEEANYMFNDNLNVDIVADIIQNRANLYVSENK